LSKFQRGYSNKDIVSSFHLVSDIEREILLPYKIKNKNDLDFSKNLFYFHNFNFNIYNFNDFIFSSIYKSYSKFPFLKSFSCKIINRVENNLNSILVHNFNLQKKFSFFTKKCNSCRICDLIYHKDYLNLKLSYISISLQNNTTCSSKNIIYFIIINKLCKSKLINFSISVYIYTFKIMNIKIFN